jgi:hypothetical protein
VLAKDNGRARDRPIDVSMEAMKLAFSEEIRTLFVMM